jgi:hypothetical protein
LYAIQQHHQCWTTYGKRNCERIAKWSLQEKPQVEKKLCNHEILVKEKAFKYFSFQPIWEGYSKPHNEVALYTNWIENEN